MWRPRALGIVIAERTLRFDRPRRRPAAICVRFGRPVRAPRPERGDPWWCPVQISGLGKRQLETIAGEDSLQALILALEFASRVLPVEAERAGGHLQWLGERESLIFANTFASGLLARNLENCIKGLVDAVGVLESSGARPAAKPLAHRLRALIVSGGHTADPSRVLRLSNKALQRTGRSGRSSPGHGMRG
jgi:hypothetical protein